MAVQREPHIRKAAAEVCTAVTELRQIYSQSDVTELPDTMVKLLRLFPLHVPPRFARRVDRGWLAPSSGLRRLRSGPGLGSLERPRK